MKHVTCNGDIESPVLWPLLSPAAQPLLAGRKAARDLVSKITANEESSRCSVRAGCPGSSCRGHSGCSVTVRPE